MVLAARALTVNGTKLSAYREKDGFEKAASGY